MKTVIVYYSLGGFTKKIAQQLAAKTGARRQSGCRGLKAEAAAISLQRGEIRPRRFRLSRMGELARTADPHVH